MGQLLLRFFLFYFLKYIHSCRNVIRHDNYAETTILNPSLIITLLSTRQQMQETKEAKDLFFYFLYFLFFKALKSIGSAVQNNCHMFLALISPPHAHLIAHQLSCQVCYIPLMASLTISKTMPHKTIWTGTSPVAEGDGFWCDENKSQGQSLSLFKSI